MQSNDQTQNQSVKDGADPAIRQNLAGAAPGNMAQSVQLKTQPPLASADQAQEAGHDNLLNAPSIITINSQENDIHEQAPTMEQLSGNQPI